jgi:A/G-specific adenine glycosylase
MSAFSKRLLDWHKDKGRKDLPWQQNITPYRVWISEIMLQQTQVSTATPYFLKFIQRFPNIDSLADSSEDEVLSYWSGLGYYSRARNILKSAKSIKSEFKSKLPKSMEELVSLPGIGRSTAGAILSIGYGLKAPILDGNVKRVLSRYFKIEEDLSKSSAQKELWLLAEKLLPKSNFNIYTQAIMDLGALVCKKKNPICSSCPQSKHCLANKYALTESIPTKMKKKEKPQKTLYWLVAMDQEGRFALQQKDEKGAWHGLWTFLEFEETGLREDYSKNLMKESNLILKDKLKIKHSFSHYNLDIDSLILKFESNSEKILGNNQMWFNLNDLKSVGTPAPVSKIIEKVI